MLNIVKRLVKVIRYRQEVRKFDIKLLSGIPILFLTQFQKHESFVQLASGVLPGIVLESDNLDADSPDWRIRKLYRHCFIKKREIIILIELINPVSETVNYFVHSPLISSESKTHLPLESLDTLKEKLLSDQDPEIVAKWFDRVIGKMFKFDICQKSFPSSGYNILIKDNLKLLLVKPGIYEQVNFLQIIDLLDVSPAKKLLKIPSSKHVSEHAWEQAFDRIVLPYSYIQKICDSKYFRQFFDETDFRLLVLKWCDFNMPFPPEILKDLSITLDQPLPNIVRHDIDRFRFWFIDIPRTSSSSIKVELGKRYGISFGKSRLIETNLATTQIIPNHIPARRMRDNLGKQLWSDLFTFALVRNPWDRMVSLYQYRSLIGNIPNELGFREYIRELFKSRGRGLFKYHGFYYSNLDYISGENGEIIVNFVGKYETRDLDLQIIARKLGCPELGTLHLQSGKKGNSQYNNYYDDETKRIVAEIYSKDIEFFNYTFE